MTPSFQCFCSSGRRWPKNNGIRIDHLLLSPEAADRMTSAAIEKHVRAWEKPSDHVPVIVYFDFAA
ncbi:exonuclease III [Rhizobium aethiopicum]|uniref:Exonuclease III n=1 Tax=Rhizobium aethiopicum TaxID=1138170 RepID=A0A7W6QD21_9HYPH|nr:exonuclease III [Rhizobium aethiopicum]